MYSIQKLNGYIMWNHPGIATVYYGIMFYMISYLNWYHD